jgi:hypothetical protein
MDENAGKMTLFITMTETETQNHASPP